MGASLGVNNQAAKDEAARRKIEFKIAQSENYTPGQCVDLCAELRELLLLAKTAPPPAVATAVSFKEPPKAVAPAKPPAQLKKSMTEAIVPEAVEGDNNLENRWLACGPARRSSRGRASPPPPRRAPGGRFEDSRTFRYVTFGLTSKQKEELTLATPAMGISHWHKFLKDHKLFKKRYTKTDSDLAFTKAAKEFEQPKKLAFQAFLRAIELTAEKLGINPNLLEEAILKARDTPSSTGTKTEYVKFADPSNFTGISSRGGPTNIDANAIDLRMLTDRNKKACVRGAVAVSASGT